MFRILSLDGGGARGAFTAGFLQEIEDKLGEPLIDYFDLISGTSTGGVIAILLAIGQKMDSIEKIYTEHLDRVFTHNEPHFKGFFGKSFSLIANPFTKYFTGVTLDELFKSKYSFEGTITILKEMTNNIKLNEIVNTRLAIPSTNLIHGKPYVFKTPHLPEQSDTSNFYALDVILATAAAPIYFDPITLPGYGIFTDGGVWANNPGLVAYAEAVKIASVCKREHDPTFSIDDIQLLSIGTGHAIENFSPPYLRAGIKWWTKRLLELMFEAQTQSSSFYLDRLMHNRYVRVNFERPHPDWGQIDDYRYAKDMAQMGRLLAKKKFPMLRDQFFTHKKEPFVPYKQETTSHILA